MRVKAAIMTLGCALSFNVAAGTIKSVKGHPWSAIGGLGYTWYHFGYSSGSTAGPAAQHAIGDGQTAFGRFAIAREILSFKLLHFGLELGVQSENQMRLDVPQTTLNELGMLPVQISIKPMLDLLVSAATNTLLNTPAFAVAKVGVAYRRMQINDRITVNDLSQTACEVQAGLGVNISDRASLALTYQGVLHGSTHFTVNPVNSIGHISNIPNQNGILLTLSYKV